MANRFGTDFDSVNKLIKNEPVDFYEKLYNILETDCNKFDLNFLNTFILLDDYLCII